MLSQQIILVPVCRVQHPQQQCWVISPISMFKKLKCWKNHGKVENNILIATKHFEELVVVMALPDGVATKDGGFLKCVQKGNGKTKNASHTILHSSSMPYWPTWLLPGIDSPQGWQWWNLRVFFKIKDSRENEGNSRIAVITGATLRWLTGPQIYF